MPWGRSDQHAAQVFRVGQHISVLLSHLLGADQMLPAKTHLPVGGRDLGGEGERETPRGDVGR